MRLACSSPTASISEAESTTRCILVKIFSPVNMRRVLFILLVICLFQLLRNNYLVRINSEVYSEVTAVYNHSGYILNTPVCKIPKLHPFDASVKHLIFPMKPYVCYGDPVFLIALPNSTIILNETVLEEAYHIPPENISCSYISIFREEEPKGQTGENYISYGKSKVLQFGVPLGEEFIKVHCMLGTKEFTHYMALVPLKPSVEEKAEKAEKDIPDALNVILIGIDSVSKLNFLRHFKKTHNFLVSNMSSFDMKGYTKVADNTFPNLVPMLTGHFVEHYWNESVKDTMFLDHLDFIWNAYSRKGYRTFYAEDSPYTGTFNYLKRGFKNPPTDYYFRPLALAIDESDLKKNSSAHCLNNQLDFDLMYGYLKDFVKTMRDRPYFAFDMVSTLTHDYLNKAGYADEPTYNLLKELLVNGVANQSMIVIFSDHGIRFGSIRETYIGKFEERMPFMYVTLPEWFLRKYESIAKNLNDNKNRLITLFDIHATLYQLLNLNKTITNEEKLNITPNGLSLFSKISEYRTCAMANILPHWCPCHVYHHVQTDDKIVSKVASAIVEEINKQLEPFKTVCEVLELDQITDARLGHANDMVLRFVKHENVVLDRYVVYGDKVSPLSDYLVTLRALPGEGLFEGTVRHDAKNESLKILGISRINMYGKQSTCIDSQNLKKYCFCK